jgi:hypothetical protein
MAALIVTNVLSSSLEVTYDYLNPDELFGYTVRGTYVVDISDINIEKDDTTLIQGRDAIIHAYGRPNIVARIGADEYLNGRIDGFNFSAGALVGSETVTIVIEEGRRLDDYSSTQFAKFIPNPHDLESFTESYNFDRNGSTYNSTRNVSLSYKKDAGGQFLNDAKTFLTNYYFGNRPTLGYQEDGISENARIDKNFRGLISENYDLINLSVSLSEKVSSSFVDPSNKVSRKQTQDLQINEQGHLTKIHKIELQSLRLDSENVLTSAIGQIVDELKTAEKDQFGNPFSISKGISKDGNTASLTVSFSTDPNKSSETIESYSGTETKAGRFKEYDLSIKYNSEGKNNRQKFLKSKQAWVAGQHSNIIRVSRLFSPTVEIYEKSKSTTFAKTEGMITETVKFTTDDSYKENDDGVLKVKTTLSKNHQINRIDKVFDLANLEEHVVQSSLKTLGSATVSASATASQGAGLYRAKHALESRTSVFNDLVDEDIIHITSDVVSLNLGDGSASRTLNYIFIQNA